MILLPFLSITYYECAVKNTTPKDRQIIFMDAMFNAQYDVEVLSAAFNMDKAEYQGALYLIDDWSSFDNERWNIIRKESTWVEEVTEEELALLKDVKAVLVDENWFQVYDNNNKFTEKFVASGDYWNYFYHVWKTVSHSPFSNAVVFVTSAASTELPASFDMEINTKIQSSQAVTLTFAQVNDEPALVPQQVNFVQTEALTQAGIAVQPYGSVIIPASQIAADINLVVDLNGTAYYASAAITSVVAVGEKVTFTQNAPAGASVRQAAPRKE